MRLLIKDFVHLNPLSATKSRTVEMLEHVRELGNRVAPIGVFDKEIDTLLSEFALRLGLRSEAVKNYGDLTAKLKQLPQVAAWSPNRPTPPSIRPIRPALLPGAAKRQRSNPLKCHPLRTSGRPAPPSSHVPVCSAKDKQNIPPGPPLSACSAGRFSAPQNRPFLTSRRRREFPQPFLVGRCRTPIADFPDQDGHFFRWLQFNWLAGQDCRHGLDQRGLELCPVGPEVMP